jgi:hypothetical protein
MAHFAYGGKFFASVVQLRQNKMVALELTKGPLFSWNTGNQYPITGSSDCGRRDNEI